LRALLLWRRGRERLKTLSVRSLPDRARETAATDDRRPLTLEGIGKRWPGADANVLEDVHLVVQPGSTVFVGGPNGAGKTTLLRIAAGLLLPDRGSVRLGPLHAEADRTSFQRRVGFLSAASAGLYARLTVRDHLRFWSRIALLPRGLQAQRRTRTAEAFDLMPVADRRVDRLSMGQRQRVRLAAAFLHDPDVVLLDEPANSLDETGLSLLDAEVRRVSDEGRAALWCAPVTQRELISSHRCLTLDDGQLLEP
jgi:ABC-2 type transport system ATP-binding protein